MLGYLLWPLPAGALADRHDRKRIMIAALSYLASLVTLPFIRTPMQAPAGRGAPRNLRAELRKGLAFTWRQPFLRYASIFGAAVNLLLQVVVLGLIVLGRHYGASPAQIGIIVGCFGVGGLAGGLS